MKKKLGVVPAIVILTLGIVGMASANPGYMATFNTKYGTTGTALNSCLVCHMANPPTSPYTRNPFGTDFASTTITGHTAHSFDAALESRDSDGDGFTNIA